MVPAPISKLETIHKFIPTPEDSFIFRDNLGICSKFFKWDKDKNEGAILNLFTFYFKKHNNFVYAL